LPQLLERFLHWLVPNTGDVSTVWMSVMSGECTESPLAHSSA
jgi:hypothetical protein